MLHYFFIHLIFITILTSINITTASAQGATSTVQRRIVKEWNPSLVNQYLAKWDQNIIPGFTDPFDTHFPVAEIQPLKPMYFVRLYTEPYCGPMGSFIVRASTIRGLTPQQIRNVLALPHVPTKIVYVRVPRGAQYGLWTGIAGPITSPGHEWGQGGGEQTKIIGKQANLNFPPDPTRFADYMRLPAESYMNVQFIGKRALSYLQSVKNVNAGKIAQYLDQHLPPPYSDMEYVYTTLDYITANGQTELAMALNQISPVNFDTYSTMLFRNNLLWQKHLFEHSQIESQKINLLHSNEQRCFTTWVNLTGEQGSQARGMNRVGFNYETGALMGGMDCQIYPHVSMGIGTIYFKDHLHWHTNSGSAEINNANVGIYLNYVESAYFLNGSFIGGLNWGSAERHINFSGNGMAVLSNLVVDTLSVNRTANSDQMGHGLGLNLIAGKNFQILGGAFLPNVQVSYFTSRVSAFDESGAQDLNLHIQDFQAQTLRTQLAILFEKLFITSWGSTMNTRIQIGWAHNFPLDNRVITANLPTLGGGFSVNGDYEQANELLASTAFSAKISKKMWIEAEYNAYLSHGFNSQALSLALKYFFDM